jgi:hypothetical protein
MFDAAFLYRRLVQDFGIQDVLLCVVEADEVYPGNVDKIMITDWGEYLCDLATTRSC